MIYKYFLNKGRILFLSGQQRINGNSVLCDDHHPYLPPTTHEARQSRVGPIPVSVTGEEGTTQAWSNCPKICGYKWNERRRRTGHSKTCTLAPPSILPSPLSPAQASSVQCGHRAPCAGQCKHELPWPQPMTSGKPRSSERRHGKCMME